MTAFIVEMFFAHQREVLTVRCSFPSTQCAWHFAFTDYCCSEGPWDPSFSDYVEQRGYHLCTVEQYESLLRKSGFEVMGASDVTESFIRHCERGVKTH